MKTFCQASIKQSTQQGGREMYKMEGPKSRQKEETTNEGGLQEEIINEGGSQGEHEQIKYSNQTPQLQGSY
jgi:hypothetical protein